MKIKIKYFTDMKPIEKIQKGDWIDLRCAEDITLFRDDFKLLKLGVAMQLPEGYEAHVVPRSSTFKKWGIIQANHFGVIDEFYCGDDDQWRFPAYATKFCRIFKNDRICQFRIEKKMPKVKFEVVKKLNNKNRGGFGSTGTN